MAFWVPGWLPITRRTQIANAIGLSEKLFPIFAIAFVGISLALTVGIGSLRLVEAYAQATDHIIHEILKLFSMMEERITATNNRIIEILTQHTEAIGETAKAFSIVAGRPVPTIEAVTQRKSLSQLTAATHELANLRGELETVVTPMVKDMVRDMENRLRGEWRFVVALIVAIFGISATVVVLALSRE